MIYTTAVVGMIFVRETSPRKSDNFINQISNTNTSKKNEKSEITELRVVKVGEEFPFGHSGYSSRIRRQEG